jgi:glycosyltransferase involved in cell wall biosynthesis
MPVYNESATVAEAIGQAVTLGLPIGAREIIVVDDGSTDDTAAILATTSWPCEVTVLTHRQNSGKGTAIRTGLAQATGRFTIVFDADLELEVSDIALLLTPLMEDEAGAVFGARHFPRNSARKLRYWLGNRAVTLAANALFRESISDVMTGFKAMSTEVFRSLALHETGFGIEAEITARLLQASVRIREVPVHYEPRARKEGKKLTMLDGFRVLRTLVRCRFSARAEPAPPAELITNR